MLESVKELISKNKVDEALLLITKVADSSNSKKQYFEETILILSSRHSDYKLKSYKGYDNKQQLIEIKESILRIAIDINEFEANNGEAPIVQIIPLENFNIARVKRHKRKRDYRVLIGITILIAISLIATSMISNQDHLYTLVALSPLVLIKWIKNKLDGIEDSLSLLEMLENEIKAFLERLKNPPVPNADETVISLKQKFWDIVK